MKRNMKIELSLDKRKWFDNIYFSVGVCVVDKVMLR